MHTEKNGINLLEERDFCQARIDVEIESVNELTPMMETKRHTENVAKLNLELRAIDRELKRRSERN